MTLQDIVLILAAVDLVVVLFLLVRFRKIKVEAAPEKPASPILPDITGPVLETPTIAVFSGQRSGKVSIPTRVKLRGGKN